MFKAHHIPNRRILGIALMVLPLLIASMGMLWGNSRMLDGISVSVDLVDEQRTWQAVSSALNNEVKGISNIMSDNAKWDDAADHSYGSVNEEWLLDTWGYSSADANYDTAFLIESDGKTLIGFQGGQRTEKLAQEFYGSTFAKILLDLPRDRKTFSISSTLVKTENGMAVMAAAPILPHSADKTISAPDSRFLVFSKAIDPEALKLLGEQYVIEGLEWSAINTSDEAQFIVNDKWRSGLAAVKWLPSHLGYLARNSYFWGSVGAVLALLVAMLPVAIGLGRTLMKLEANEKSARAAARVDALSGLPNRLSFYEFLQDHLNRQKTANCAVLLIDLDGFKLVNDVFDHATGDRLIVAVAAGLRCLIGDHCKIARLGGDEFAIAVIAPDAREQAIGIAKNIMKFFKEPFDLDGRIAKVGASIGMTSPDEDVTEAQELLRRADIAMYSVKEAGAGNYKFFDPSLDSKTKEDLAIADELRAMLVRQDFDINYQPLVDANTKKIVGVEALARWPKSSLHRISPDRFIAVAEQFGLIDALGLLIMKMAFRDAAAWPGLRLSLNISPLQLNNHRLISEMKAAALENNFDLKRLEVEFTEAILIKSAKRAKEVIQELQRLGVSVALDDFGTGYASVKYLREFEFDTIKLDRSLTSQTAASFDALKIVQGTVLIAQGLSAAVVAEGVETEGEAAIMSLAGCQLLQGYYFGKPQAAAAIREILKTSSSPRKSA